MSSSLETQFITTIEANKGKIYRICKVYAVAPMEPADLFQEVVYEVWKALPSFNNQSTIDTWLYRVALNVCYSANRKDKEKSQRSVRLDSISIEPKAKDYSIEMEQNFKTLKNCIGNLETMDRSIVMLHLDELPYKQIADITGLTENHIAVKLKRIRNQLSNCFRAKNVAI